MVMFFPEPSWLDGVADFEDSAGPIKRNPFFGHGFVQVMDGHDAEFVGHDRFFQVLAYLNQILFTLHFDKHRCSLSDPLILAMLPIQFGPE